jgi:hypothetical protein
MAQFQAIEPLKSVFEEFVWEADVCLAVLPASV